MKSAYAKKVPIIVAEMEEGREDETTQADQLPEKVVYLYPFEGGGIVMTDRPIEDESGIVDSREPETDERPTTRRQPPYFLHFLLILFLFIGLDNVDSFLLMLAPTVTVTITPQVKTIATTGTVSVGDGADIHGRVLPSLTLSQAQTVNATGRGHQDATRATGTLTFYNGSFASQTVDAGTVYTGSDGVQVAIDQTVTIPAANPPYVGAATVSASAILAGASGNIHAGDIAISTNTLQVRNSQFTNGQNARDFTIVTRADIDQAAAILKAQVAQSMQAALQGQVRAGEQLLNLPCNPTASADHRVGDEALQVHITVSATCSSLAYDPAQLISRATRQLTTQAAKQLGRGYMLYGNVTISAIEATATSKKNVVLSFRTRGTWVYQINEARIQALVSGKNRLDALHILSTVNGVQSVSIAGVSDNSQLPTDAAHIHILLIAEV